VTQKAYKDINDKICKNQHKTFLMWTHQ